MLDLWSRAQRAGWPRVREELLQRLRAVLALILFRVRRVRNRAGRSWARLRHGAALPVTRVACLDADHLWITMDVPGDGRFVARSSRRHRVVFSNEVTAGPQTVRLAVAELGGDGTAAWTLFFHHEGKDQRLGLVNDMEPPPTVPPVSRAHRWTHRVVDNGVKLKLIRAETPTAVEVARIGEHDGHLEVAWSAIHGDDLRLVGRGHDVAAVSTVTDGDRVTGRIPVDVALAAGREADVVLRTVEGDLPLGRADHDLRQPNAMLVLPELESPEGNLRFWWTPSDGLLQVRRVKS